MITEENIQQIIKKFNEDPTARDRALAEMYLSVLSIQETFGTMFNQFAAMAKGGGIRAMFKALKNSGELEEAI